MLKAKLAALVNICTRHAWPVIAVALMITVVSGVYAMHNFAINTNVNQLISPNLPWRQRELAFVDAFQGNYRKILAVVDAATSERATAASRALAAKLKAESRRIGRPLKEIVNETLRTGLASPVASRRHAFTIAARDLGNLRPELALDNVAELIEQVEGPLHR